MLVVELKMPVQVSSKSCHQPQAQEGKKPEVRNTSGYLRVVPGTTAPDHIPLEPGKASAAAKCKDVKYNKNHQKHRCFCVEYFYEFLPHFLSQRREKVLPKAQESPTQTFPALLLW